MGLDTYLMRGVRPVLDPARSLDEASCTGKKVIIFSIKEFPELKGMPDLFKDSSGENVYAYVRLDYSDGENENLRLKYSPDAVLIKAHDVEDLALMCFEDFDRFWAIIGSRFVEGLDFIWLNY